MIYGMIAVKKITVHIPEYLLKKAQKATGEGVTSTVRQGLELVSARPDYEALRVLRGKVRFSVPLKTLRYDRT